MNSSKASDPSSPSSDDTSPSVPIADENRSSAPVKKFTSERLTAFEKQLESLSSPEEKVECAFHFMKEQLASRKIAYLKEFWEARKSCLELLKDKVKPENRHRLWSQFKDMTQEALQLREILDEENNFAAEQIELAIEALEQEVANPSSLPSAPSIQEELFPDFLASNQSFYQQHQKDLYFLNAFASRINAFRKELVKTEMRIKRKNDLFQRLSKLGDEVFPRRKDLIKTLSEHFESEVEKFLKPLQEKGLSVHPLFKIREYIKSLQGLAKVLTLNTSAFNSTRLHLSKIWDEVKTEEKKKRSERFEKKNKMKERLQGLEEKFVAFEKDYQQAPFSMQEADKRIDEIISHFKTLHPSRDEWKWLKGQIARVKKPLMELQDKEEEERKQKLLQEESHRKEKVAAFEKKLKDLFSRLDTLSVEKLQEEKQPLIQEMHKLKTTKAEKQNLERQLRKLKDSLTEKREQEILSADTCQASTLSNLKGLLKDKQKRRQEIKDHIESLRLASGGSGLDFEKAMEYDQQMKAEKQTLGEIEKSLKDLEKKIKDLKA